MTMAGSHGRETEAVELESRECRGAPLLLVFGRPAAPGESLEHAGLYWQIARERDRPSGLVFLHDRERSGFYRGATWFGTTIDEVRQTLQAMVAELAPSELVTCGAGIGGHAALVFGILLGAARIVAFEPPGHLIADELALYNDRRWHLELAELPDPAEASRFDPSALIAETGFRGRIRVLLGTQRSNAYHDAVHQNVVHAHRLARSDRVVLYPFPEVEHGVLDWLVRRGDARDVLSRVLFEETAAPIETRSVPPLDLEKLRISSKRFQKFKYQVCRFEHPHAREEGPEAVVSFAAAGQFDEPAPHKVGETPPPKVDDDWRCWIAENLMLGASPTGLEETMADRGISQEEASEEIWKAMQSPYLWGAQRLRNRLKKRDWLLATYRKLRRLHSEAGGVASRYRLGPGEFRERHYAVNRHVIVTGLIDDWPALWTWSLDDLARRFGDRNVEVQIHQDDTDAPQDPPLTIMTVAEVVERFRDAESGPSGEGVSLVAGQDAGSLNGQALGDLWDDLGPIPGYLAGEDHHHGGSLRLGSAGSATPLRLNLENLLVAQVLGRTRFKISPSWDVSFLRPSRNVFSDFDGRKLPAAPYPGPDQPQVLEGLLEPGELLFLPVGWWSCTEATGTSATLSFTRLALDNQFADSYPNAPRA